jgi:hypothetical protein
MKFTLIAVPSPGHELDDWLQAEREIMGWV